MCERRKLVEFVWWKGNRGERGEIVGGRERVREKPNFAFFKFYNGGERVTRSTKRWNYI